MQWCFVWELVIHFMKYASLGKHTLKLRYLKLFYYMRVDVVAVRFFIGEGYYGLF